MFLTTYLYVQFAALPEQSSSYQFSGCIIKCNINRTVDSIFIKCIFCIMLSCCTRM